MLRFSNTDIHSATRLASKMEAYVKEMGYRQPPPAAPEWWTRELDGLSDRLRGKLERSGTPVKYSVVKAVSLGDPPLCVVCKDVVVCGAIECRECKGKATKEQRNQSKTERYEKTCLERYGRKNIFAGKEGANLARRSTMKKYGVSNVMHVPEIRAKYDKNMALTEEQKAIRTEKIRKTNLANSGVEHWTQDPKQMKEFRARLKRSHGVENVMHIEKVKRSHREAMERVDWDAVYQKTSATTLDRYGVENIFQDVSYMEECRLAATGSRGPWSSRSKAKYKKKTGFDHPLHNPTILEGVLSKGRSSSLKREQVDFDRSKLVGNPRSVLGYEPHVINSLSCSPNVERIVVGKALQGMPYSFRSSDRTYFPDLGVVYTSGKKVLLEVKSSYTLLNALPQNFAKFKAAHKAANGRFLLALVMNQRVLYIRNPHLLVRRLMRASHSSVELYSLATKVASHVTSISSSSSNAAGICVR